MKKSVFVLAFVAVLISLSTLSFAQGTIVFNNIPTQIPPNVPSKGFQCCATSEIGDLIQLEPDTPRNAGYVTVLMSSWSLHSNYPSMPSVGYAHPITLNIYANEASAASHAPLANVTQTFTIPWRPEADPTCPGGTAWKDSETQRCFNGFAFTITFDLTAQDIILPDEFIYGIAYNTNTWGYNPLGVPGPYESLNVGTANVNGVADDPTVGEDVNPDEVFWNTSYGPFYADGGTAGVGFLRPDTGWTDYPIAVKFTTFGFPTTTSSCKNGAWQNLVRSNFTPFKNQGDCVSYVNTGK